jgi:hypothetical protein
MLPQVPPWKVWSYSGVIGPRPVLGFAGREILCSYGQVEIAVERVSEAAVRSMGNAAWVFLGEEGVGLV